MPIYELNGKRPRIHRTARILDGAVVAGDVIIGPYTLICWNAVVYAEETTLEIGHGVCISDGALVHAKENPIRIGDYSLVGHGAQVCDACVEDHALVGIGAIVVDGACVARESMLAGDSFLRGKGVRTTSGMMWAGRPATEAQIWTKDIAWMEARARTRVNFFDSLKYVELETVEFE
jgi:carbonic anhydrase/acetyltransferase-like protein (isoleucine patch superfamily)